MDRDPPSEPASAWEDGMLAPQGRCGEFQLLQYDHKFQQLSTFSHFQFHSVNGRFSQKDRKSGTSTSAIKI